MKWDMPTPIFSRISVTGYSLFVQDDFGMGEGSRKHGQ